MAPQPERAEDLASFWNLDPDVVFLNHGSYGACPRPVLEAQERLRTELERNPVRFLTRVLEGLQDEARRELAAFVGADPANLAFIPNTTTGVNTVLRSLSFQPEDELLTTTHVYNACRNALEFAAERAGAKVVVAPVPFPIQSPEQVRETVLGALTPGTRLALLDHLASPSGLLFPIAQLVRELRSRGVETLVDGAHAPGAVPLDLEGLGAAYYVGNCHKWLCAPKGAAFLYVRPDRQTAIRPLAISHGANSRRTDRSRFHLEFDWTGTHDPTACLAVPSAIRFLGSLLPGGWVSIMERNHALALEARALLCRELGVPPPCPDEMLGPMAAIPLPGTPAEPGRSGICQDPLQVALYQRFKIEAPVTTLPAHPVRFLRISAHLYNSPEQYKRLSRTLAELLKGSCAK